MMDEVNVNAKKQPFNGTPMERIMPHHLLIETCNEISKRATTCLIMSGKYHLFVCCCF